MTIETWSWNWDPVCGVPPTAEALCPVRRLSAQRHGPAGRSSPFLRGRESLLSEAGWHGWSLPAPSPGPYYLSPAWEGQYVICIVLSPSAFYQYLMTGCGMLSVANPLEAPSNVTGTEVLAGVQAHRSPPLCSPGGQ